MSCQIERVHLAIPAFCSLHRGSGSNATRLARPAAPLRRRGGLLLLAISMPVDAALQSTFAMAGLEAERVAMLFWVMAVGAVLVWLLVMGIALYAGRRRQRAGSRPRSTALIVGCGVILPLLTLTPLLIYALSLLSTLRSQPASVHVDVSAEQWWWRVAYRQPGAALVVLANELRLPVGETVALHLSSSDVIHALWIPALGGKMDMLPGRRTELRLQPTRTGLYRGVCAEYCGSAHAQMAFMVEVMERPRFDAWLAAQAAPAEVPATPLATEGARQFRSNGCGGCHSIRGTDARGVIGPDLTHIGSRHSLAAAALDNDQASMQRWLRDTHSVKPDALMPAFGHLPPNDLAAIAAYLRALR